MSKEKVLETLSEGVRVGLKAFIFTYGISMLLSLVVNLSVIERLQDYLQGSLSESVGFNLGMVMKGAAIITNVSVFNASNDIRLGLLIFGGLPLLAFFVADLNDNKREGMDLLAFAHYAIASFVFSLLVLVISLFTKGDFLGVTIDFVSLRNVGMTFIITLLMQIVIGMNYNMNRLPGIRATRWMVRLVVLFSGLLAVIGLILGLTRFTTNISMIMLAVIVLGPNIAVYLLFMMIGVSLNFNNALEKLMAFGKVDLSYDIIPLWAKLFLILVFIAFILFSMTKLEKDKRLAGILGFAATYGLVSFMLAYCTRIDLGVVKGLMDVNLGIDLLRALLFPMMAVLGIGALYLAVIHFIRTMKSI